MKRLLSLLMLLLTLTGCTEASPIVSQSQSDPWAYASSLSHQHSVDIRIGEYAAEVLPWDYDILAETDAGRLLESLAQLDHCLQQYPAGMIRVLSQDAGGLHICIVREILGKEDTHSLETVKGLQFYDETEGTFLIIAKDFEHTLYHELCHVLEDFVIPRSDAWENWQDLNPDGFSYDLDFQKNLNRDGTAWLQEKDRAFVDTYSMSFPREDRARIMEYAMSEGNQDLFMSPVMQRKLHFLSQGIREAFTLTDSDLTFSWEQYLIK